MIVYGDRVCVGSILLQECILGLYPHYDEKKCGVELRHSTRMVLNSGGKFRKEKLDTRFFESWNVSKVNVST